MMLWNLKLNCRILFALDFFFPESKPNMRGGVARGDRITGEKKRDWSRQIDFPFLLSLPIVNHHYIRGN